MPTFTTNENVNFDGQLTESLVLEVIGSNKKLIQWNNIPTDIQLSLEDTINAYGGSLPISPKAGKSIINFNPAIIGTTSTGIVGAGSAGSQVIDFGGSIIGTDPTGLANDTDTATTQAYNFSVAKTGGSATGLSNAVNTAASVTILGATSPNSDVLFTALATGIAGNNITIQYVDPNAVNQVLAVNVTGTAITITLGTDVTGAITSNAASVANAIIGNTANTLVTAAAQGTGLGAVIAVPATNLINGTSEVVYTATITVNGTSNPIAIIGNTAQTFAQLRDQINANLTGAVASLNGTEFLITNNTLGSTGTLLLADTDLFSSVNDFLTIGLPTIGTDATVYLATIIIDGNNYPIAIIGNTAQTYALLVSALDAAIGVNGSVAINGGNILVTSASTGISSSVSVIDIDLFTNVTAFVSILFALTGISPPPLKANIEVDGINNGISIDGQLIATFADLIIQLNNGLSGAVASIVGGNIEIVSATTGIASKVIIKDLSLFNKLNNFKSIVVYRGVNNINDVLRYNKYSNGTSFNEILINLVEFVGPKPATPNDAASNGLVYYNGTSWLKFYDDSPA